MRRAAELETVSPATDEIGVDQPVVDERSPAARPQYAIVNELGIRDDNTGHGPGVTRTQAGRRLDRGFDPAGDIACIRGSNGQACKALQGSIPVPRRCQSPVSSFGDALTR